MVDFTRRSIILGTAGVAAAGAGVTAAAGGLQGSVEGQADVQAEQALTVTDVSANNGDEDASFTRISDDNTEFQAAVELNNGDSVGLQATIENSAVDTLDVQVIVDSPNPIDIDVRNDGSSDNDGGSDLDPDDDGETSSAVQTGEDTFVASVDGSDGDGTETLGIVAELDDTADPGSYDIGVAINPLSTDN
ncbi:hypothetical protein [Haloquadratum walsbyi]|jgi:hypothetical protein|uniref:Uncharacterized protein n=1 Tax=Haloquadratum walsbyi J07HQW2 TaxID=1238425 RepID=U1PS34_9EURY|nr:hypothetical protein [Haloquadratum walsbyi]ERG96592.1 MAG: hypothetical protein J07HQW2_03072 [Haloquadratum walsbyi J07HQW2]